MAETELAKKMHALASEHPHLAELADKFDAAAKGFYSEPQTVNVMSFMGHYARARRAYCDVTGEDLV